MEEMVKVRIKRAVEQHDRSWVDVTHDVWVDPTEVHEHDGGDWAAYIAHTNPADRFVGFVE